MAPSTLINIRNSLIIHSSLFNLCSLIVSVHIFTSPLRDLELDFQRFLSNLLTIIWMNYDKDFLHKFLFSPKQVAWKNITQIIWVWGREKKVQLAEGFLGVLVWTWILLKFKHVLCSLWKVSNVWLSFGEELLFSRVSAEGSVSIKFNSPLLSPLLADLLFFVLCNDDL